MLARERFEDFSDVKPAIKTRLRQLQIRYAPAELDDAISVVSAAGGFRFVPIRPRPVVAAITPEPRPLSRAEATALWAQLTQRFGFREKTLPRTRSRIRIDAIATPDVVDIAGQLEGAAR